METLHGKRWILPEPKINLSSLDGPSYVNKNGKDDVDWENWAGQIRAVLFLLWSHSTDRSTHLLWESRWSRPWGRPTCSPFRGRCLKIKLVPSGHRLRSRTYWGHFEINTCKTVGETRWIKAEAELKQRPVANSQGALDPGWLFIIVLSWNKGIQLPRHPIPVTGRQLPWERAVTLSKQLLSAEKNSWVGAQLCTVGSWHAKIRTWILREILESSPSAGTLEYLC